ncbi:MICOS complex subunit MIC13-like [Watersipora subatra]|uniref:MICOS complex subunit MIC13-like n=1 Tax=Watersipora subatra TaxID=2589382 RepID=UPI00355B7697
MLSRVISLTAKCGLVGGAVYVTTKAGVWSPSTEDGAEVLKGFRESVIPTTNDYIRQIPKVEDIQEAVKRRWNSGVQWSAESIANLPTVVSDGAKKSGSFVKKSLFSGSGEDN